MDNFERQEVNTNQNRQNQEDAKWEIFPTTQRMEKVATQEGESLRYHALLMLFCHSFFLFLEVFLYDFVFWMVLCETIYMWMTY